MSPFQLFLAWNYLPQDLPRSTMMAPTVAAMYEHLILMIVTKVTGTSSAPKSAQNKRMVTYGTSFGYVTPLSNMNSPLKPDRYAAGKRWRVVLKRRFKWGMRGLANKSEQQFPSWGMHVKEQLPLGVIPSEFAKVSFVPAESHVGKWWV